MSIDRTWFLQTHFHQKWAGFEHRMLEANSFKLANRDHFTDWTNGPTGQQDSKVPRAQNWAFRVPVRTGTRGLKNDTASLISACAERS